MTNKIDWTGDEPGWFPNVLGSRGLYQVLYINKNGEKEPLSRGWFSKSEAREAMSKCLEVGACAWIEKVEITYVDAVDLVSANNENLAVAKLDNKEK